MSIKRERTTSITRLRTVSDAAREGIITVGDKVSHIFFDKIR